MTLQHRLEYALARTALALFRALGPAAASNLGGWLARTIGPLLPVNRVAYVNLPNTLGQHIVSGSSASSLQLATDRALWNRTKITLTIPR